MLQEEVDFYYCSKKPRLQSEITLTTDIAYIMLRVAYPKKYLYALLISIYNISNPEFRFIV